MTEHRARTAFPPRQVIVPGVGIFCSGDDVAGATNCRLVYMDAVRVMTGAARLGGVQALSEGARGFIENWEVETYRKQIARAGKAGRVAGRVAVVTGAAQGFGLEIAQQFAGEGGVAVLADVNAAARRAPPRRSGLARRRRPGAGRGGQRHRHGVGGGHVPPGGARLRRPRRARLQRRRAQGRLGEDAERAGLRPRHRRQLPGLFPVREARRPAAGAAARRPGRSTAPTSSRSTPSRGWPAPTGTAPTPAASSAASASPRASRWSWSRTASR